MASPIKALIGLGNPGAHYYATRHNIGFRIIDTLAAQEHAGWQPHDNSQLARIELDGHPLLLIKPTTFMNSSGKVISWLHNKGIKPEEILVIHDELELPFGKVSFKQGGSARGHNGVKSIIAAGAEQSHRLRFGIDRPSNREEVPDYVLEKFTENKDLVEEAIKNSVVLLRNYLIDHFQKKQSDNHYQ
jgi:peptidyl-tRNA hydrolase, PTH1 family